MNFCAYRSHQTFYNQVISATSGDFNRQTGVHLAEPVLGHRKVYADPVCRLQRHNRSADLQIGTKVDLTNTDPTIKRRTDFKIKRWERYIHTMTT